jgi:hypothetical protein
MNHEQYKILYQALERAFNDHLKVARMSDEDLTHLVNQTLSPLPIEDFKEEIRHAILHIYATKGIKAVVVFKEGKIFTKTRISNLEDNFYVDAVATEFEDVYTHINLSPDSTGVSFIPEDLTIKLLTFLANLEGVDQKREIIKFGLKRIFDLHDRDALFFMHNKILIKKFVESHKEKEAHTKRSFDHIPKEALEYTEKEMRRQGLDHKLKTMMQEMFHDEFNFRKIDNFFFAKRFIKLLQNKFVTFITPFMKEESSENILAFSNYILRKDFDVLLSYISIELIQLLLEKDSNVEKFIGFYNGDTSFTSDGKRVQKPDIRDKKGDRWNVSTIFQIGLQRKKGLEKIRNAKIDIQKSEETIQKIEEEIKQLVRELEKKRIHLNTLNTQYQEFQTITKEKKEQIFAIKNILQNEKDVEKQNTLQLEINQLSADVKRNFKNEEENLQKKLKSESELERIAIAIKTFQKDKEAHLRKLSNNQKKLEELTEMQAPLEEKFQTVVFALARTLSSFRGV